MAHPELVDEGDPGMNQVLLSPVRRHASVSQRYLTTASAKRRRIKQNDCRFCNAIVTGKELLNHFEVKDSCKKLYMRSLRVRSEGNLASKLFSCEFCFETKQINFKKHCLSNSDCLESYLNKHQQQDLESLCKKVRCLKRAALPSRGKSARASESLKQKNRREDHLANKTQAESLNDYRSSTCMSNFKLCVLCRSNFSEYGAKEVKEHEEVFEREHLDDPANQGLRRMEKFFLCNFCNDETNDPRPKLETSLTMTEICNEEKSLFFPSSEKDHHASEESIKNNNIRVMIPSNIGAIDLVGAQKIENKNNHVSKIYETRNLNMGDIAAAYENELFKYKCIKDKEEMFFGVIKDFGKKKLSFVEKKTSDFKITGSETWFRHQLDELKFRRDQFGSFFATFSVEVPQASLDTLATCLVQEGYVVTVEKKGSASGEYVMEYIVHDHMNDKDCSDDCNGRINLVDFLETETFDVSSLGNKHVGTYISSVHQKMTSIIKHIIQAPSSGLFSENFYVTLTFDMNGQARVLGVIWPTEIEEINLDFAENGGKLGMKDELLNYVERNISVSCDPRILRSSMNVSESEANLLSDLVKKHQINSQDSPPKLPSMRTLLTEVSSSVNFEAAESFLKFMIEMLKTLSFEEKDQLSTFDWLELVWEGVTGEITDDNKFITVEFNEDEEVSFEIDEKLSFFLAEFDGSPLTAVYHFALTCSNKDLELCIVFRRLRIAECFMEPFNALFLKASDSLVTITVGRSFKMFENLLMNRNEDLLSSRLSNPNLVLTHREVSLTECLFSFDKTKKRVKPSTAIGFVNARAKRQFSFKKVATKSDENFKVEGTTDEFEMMSSIISRHFNRINGRGLLLAETVTWFEYTSKEKSKEIYQTYINCLANIPLSDTKCVSPVEESELIPSFLLCRNGDVLKKRTKLSVLVYPLAKTTYDIMYSRLLMFYPLESEDDLSSDLRSKFLKQHEEEQGTVVDVNERRLFKYKLQEIKTNIDEQLEHSDESFGEEALDCLLDALDSDDSLGGENDILMEALN